MLGIDSKVRLQVLFLQYISKTGGAYMAVTFIVAYVNHQYISAMNTVFWKNTL
jgi:hypothetical protein